MSRPFYERETECIHCGDFEEYKPCPYCSNKKQRELRKLACRECHEETVHGIVINKTTHPYVRAAPPLSAPIHTTGEYDIDANKLAHFND